MGLNNHNNRNAYRPDAFEYANPLDHDENVVVSFEAAKVRDVFRHAFSSTDRRGEYRVPDSSLAKVRTGDANENNKERAKSPEKRRPTFGWSLILNYAFFLSKREAPPCRFFWPAVEWRNPGRRRASSMSIRVTFSPP